MKSFLLLITITLSYNLMAEENHHKANHHEVKSLSLNNGKKWAVDQIMKKNIEAIHEKISTSTSHDSTFYKQLEQVLDKAILDITSNCKMPKKQDETFHVILAELIESKENLSNINKQANALHNLKNTLKTYSLYFDHNLSK